MGLTVPAGAGTVSRLRSTGLRRWTGRKGASAPGRGVPQEQAGMHEKL